MAHDGLRFHAVQRALLPGLAVDGDIYPRLVRMLVICSANALLWAGILVVTTGLV